MIVHYFSVLDKKASTYGQMFPSVTIGTAERAFSDGINSPDSLIGKHSDDYALYLICDFDDDTGLVVNRYDPPQFVVEASALVS